MSKARQLKGAELDIIVTAVVEYGDMTKLEMIDKIDDWSRIPRKDLLHWSRGSLIGKLIYLTFARNGDYAPDDHEEAEDDGAK